MALPSGKARNPTRTPTASGAADGTALRAEALGARLPPLLVAADRVFCHAGTIDWDVAQALAPLGDRVCVERDLGVLVEAIVAQARPGDVVLVMSNGGFGGIHDRLLRALDAAARQG